MAIEKVTLVNIMGKISSLNSALLKISKSEMFHIEKVKPNNKIINFKELNEKNPYSEVLDKTNKILKTLNIKPKFNDYNSLNHKTIEEITAIVDEFFKQTSEKNKSISNLKTKISLIEKSLQQLSEIKNSSFELNKIFSASFVSSHFGRMPSSNYVKLEYFENEPIFFIPIKNDTNFYWGLFIGLKNDEKKLQEIMQSLYFEQYYQSKQFENNPKSTIENLENELEKSKNKLENLELELENYKTQYEQNLLCIYSKFKTLYSIFNFRKFAVSNNKFFYINGFVLKKNLNAFNNLFEDVDDVMIETVQVENEEKQKLKLPIKLKTNAIFKPFELLIETFGLPNYETKNPTSFIGFIYCFLFGLMFGDVGQGLCLFTAGIVFWLWKKNVLGLILTRCAFSSCVFGLIYDSCFGFEGLFKNFWKMIKIFPILPFNLLKGKNAVTILIISLILGMILTNISILTNILINIKNKNYKQATISGNGLTGLAIYGGITTVAFSILIFQKNILNPIFLTIVIILPIILIFLEQPIFNFFDVIIFKKSSKTKFNFLNSALETFETVLNYFTNTLSFLRVGGFAMSHAALMLVVVKFCEKCSNIVASPLIAIFGNIFVISLEGMVVSIQVLRLIYYEIFSRFYKSDGRKFEPAKIIF